MKCPDCDDGLDADGNPCDRCDGGGELCDRCAEFAADLGTLCPNCREDEDRD